jgi:ABC-2 type transport system ATP-binding protein
VTLLLVEQNASRALRLANRAYVMDSGRISLSGPAADLLHNPEVLILDEPTSGLDPNQLADIRALIKQVAVGKTIIFSTHIMQEVQALCNRVLVINQGRLVADAPIAALQQAGKDTHTVRVEFDRPADVSALAALPGIGHLSHVAPNTYTISPADPATDIRPVVFAFAVQHGLTILSQTRADASLEDVFRSLTGKE